MPAAEAPKQQAAAAVDDVAAELLAASREIHARPELGYEEVFASGRLASLLRDHRLDVQHPAVGLPTSFAARAGAGDGPLVAVCPGRERRSPGR